MLGNGGTHLFLLGQKLVVFDGQLFLKSSNLLSQFRDCHHVIRRIGVDQRVSVDHRSEYLGSRASIFPVTEAHLYD